MLSLESLAVPTISSCIVDRLVVAYHKLSITEDFGKAKHSGESRDLILGPGALLSVLFNWTPREYPEVRSRIVQFSPSILWDLAV